MWKDGHFVQGRWVKSITLSDTTWFHWYLSTLGQVMAWCLMTPSHHLVEPAVIYHHSGHVLITLVFVSWKFLKRWMTNMFLKIVYIKLRQPRIWCCHYLPPDSLLALRASESLSYSHVSLIWYKMFCMADISYRFIWMKFINMLSVYAQSGMHRHFKWWIIAVLT